MRASELYDKITSGGVGTIRDVLGLLDEDGVRYCVIGGQAVNYYAEPLVSLDLDLVVATDKVERVASLLARHFTVRRFPHSINVTPAGSDLRIQIQTDPRYGDFVARSQWGEVLGTPMSVASVADVMRGKVWAAQDESRRPSKRRKDLLDIERLIEAQPDLRDLVPEEVLRRLEL